jgi:hypothetical protein
MPDSPAFRHLNIPLQGEKGYIHGGDGTSARPTLQVMDTPCISIVHTAGGGKGYTLHVHTADIGGGGEKDTCCRP